MCNITKYEEAKIISTLCYMISTIVIMSNKEIGVTFSTKKRNWTFSYRTVLVCTALHYCCQGSQAERSIHMYYYSSVYSLFYCSNFFCKLIKSTSQSLLIITNEKNVYLKEHFSAANFLFKYIKSYHMFIFAMVILI